MLERLFRSFRKDESPEEETAQDLSHAFAALLVEAARADEEYTDEERALVDKFLKRQFSIDAAQALAIRTAAEAAQDKAHDLYQFSRVVKDGLDRDGKMQLIEDMWRIVLSDDHRDPHEEMVIRRLIGLIHLEDRDSAEARRRAEASS